MPLQQAVLDSHTRARPRLAQVLINCVCQVDVLLQLGQTLELPCKLLELRQAAVRRLHKGKEQGYNLRGVWLDEPDHRHEQDISRQVSHSLVRNDSLRVAFVRMATDVGMVRASTEAGSGLLLCLLCSPLIVHVPDV